MRKVLQILIIAVTAVTWLVSAWINGLPTSLIDAAKPFALAITAAGLTVWLYESRLWHLRYFRHWLTRTPNLSGVWKVDIHSTWIDPQTGQRIGPTRGFVQIDQTASTFTLRMFTEKSNSSTVASAFRLEQNVFQLTIVYENRPDVLHRGNDYSFHQGAAIFNVRGYQPPTIHGEYWTERKNTGKLVLTEPKKGEINSFSDGQKFYGIVDA